MIHLVIGRRERGKTTLAYYMAAKVSQRLIFDPRGLIERAGSVRLKSAADLEGKGIPALVDNEVSEIVYAPMEDDIQGAFRRFCMQVKWWVLNHPTRPLAVLVDEVSFVNLEEPAFQWITRCSKRDVLQIFLTGHRPADVPTSVRAIADYWLLFQCRQEHDLDVIESRCTRGTVQAVQRLNAREFVMWDDEHARFQIYKEARAWFVPLSTGLARRVSVADPLDIAPAPVDDGKLFS